MELTSNYGKFDILWLDGGWVTGDEVRLDEVLTHARSHGHEGLIQPEVETCLRQVGKWLKTNGQAIYNTRITSVYNDGKTWFTANKDGKTLYAIYTLADNEKLPATIEWEGNIPTGTMKLLNKNISVHYQCVGNKVKVTLPKGLAQEPLAFRFTVKK